MLAFFIGIWGLVVLACIAHRRARLADLRAASLAAQKDFEQAAGEFAAVLAKALQSDETPADD